MTETNAMADLGQELTQLNANAASPNLPDADYHRQQLEAVCNNATLAFFILDEFQHCSYMNPAAEKLTGYSLAEVQGRALHDIIHHTRPDGSPFPLADCPIAPFCKTIRSRAKKFLFTKTAAFIRLPTLPARFNPTAASSAR